MTMYDKIKEIQNRHLKHYMEQKDKCLKNAILSCGYQLDEVEQYAKQNRRFEFSCIKKDVFEYQYFLKDKYKSVTYFLMKEVFSNGDITIQTFKNLEVK